MLICKLTKAKKFYYNFQILLYNFHLHIPNHFSLRYVINILLISYFAMYQLLFVKFGKQV